MGTAEPGAAVAQHQGGSAVLQASCTDEVLPGPAVRPAGSSSAVASPHDPQLAAASAGEQAEVPSSAPPGGGGRRHLADSPQNGQLSAATGPTAAMADVSESGAPLLPYTPLVLVLPPLC